ncbi:DNA polymerase I [Niveispirillum sp. SYP-B3756]|uniref:DNA polymerase I n=1 Tax=Niveispirillum sp. SYP-B3756 TaxID=2662178 RepID=UPI00129161BE|nr:DNA polymerase I [Niveispirillum sp. SYP-B3756]MQP64237.1 DNA polymerase I [Niveispirillum sp. SYP-B3756]
MPTDIPAADPAALPAADGSPLYLVDGSGFIFRAYHALPPLNRPDGTPVNAVMGFTNMLMKLLAELKAEAVAIIFDAKRLNFRNEFYPDYKAHRPEPPEDLRPQFALIREAVDAFNLPGIELEGYEADDLIATYARQARAQGRPVTIVSSDKDLMQLVRDGVRLLDPMKNRLIGPDEVFEKFGVTPDKVVDVQALAGDSVDNVPGVPGIGIKTAAQLITDYGDLETLLERAGEIKQAGRRQKLLENADLARISKRLVKLEENVPVPVPVEELVVREPDSARLLEWLGVQGFRGIIAKVKAEIAADGTLADGAVARAIAAGGSEQPRRDLRAALDGRSYAPTPTTSPAEVRADAHIPRPGAVEHLLVVEEADLEAWVAEGLEAGIVAVDTETDGLTPTRCNLVGISLSTRPGRACYIPIAHIDPSTPKGDQGGLDFGTAPPPPKQIALDRAMEILRPLLEHPGVLKVGHNIKFDWQMFAKHGVNVAPIDDTMLLSYVIGGGKHGHGMDELAQRHLGHSCISYDEVTGTGKARITFDRVPLDKATAYAAEDADITLRLWHVLKHDVLADHMVTVYETIERPLVPVVAQMESDGVLIDRAVLRELSGDFAKRMVELEAEIHALAGRSFNVGSPKQLGEILFDEMKLTGAKKSAKTGAYSTDSSVLEELADQGVPIAQKVLDWRQFAKLKSTYTDTLAEQIDARTGRVHTSFALAITSTGRLSSTDPNLQNIPIRTEEGRKIRRAFVAAPGHVMLSVDYSQIELRLVAEMAGIPALQQAFREGIDIHAMTASQVFGVPLAEMTSEIRRRAKAINFGIIYGISSFGLSRQLGISPGEAGAFIKAYFERFPELQTYMDKTKAEAHAQGYVTTLLGRKCWIPGIQEKGARRSYAERQAINAPIQGTAADIIKRAMIRLPAALAAAGLKARMLLQVHDELLFEVPEAEITATAALVKQVMETATDIGVPLVAEAGHGKSWAEAH